MDIYNAKAGTQDLGSPMCAEQETHLYAVVRHMSGRNKDLEELIHQLKLTRDRLNPVPMDSKKQMDAPPPPTEKDGIISQLGYQCERKDYLLDELRGVVQDLQRSI